MDSVVYEIVNNSNGKVYIGSTKDYRKRKNEHRRSLRGGVHHSVHLQRAWDTYGEECFSFKPLLFCDPSDLLFYEDVAIKVTNAAHRDYGYNIYPGAIRPAMPQETREKLSGIKTGVRMSDAVRAKMGLAQRRRFESQYERSKVAGEWTNRRRSEASVERRSRSRNAHNILFDCYDVTKNDFERLVLALFTTGYTYRQIAEITNREFEQIHSMINRIRNRKRNQRKAV